jgi:hypothetical protein
MVFVLKTIMPLNQSFGEENLWSVLLFAMTQTEKVQTVTIIEKDVFPTGAVTSCKRTIARGLLDEIFFTFLLSSVI